MQSKSFFYDNYNNYYFYLIFFKCNVIVIATDRKKITILTEKNDSNSDTNKKRFISNSKYFPEIRLYELSRKTTAW